MAIAHLVIQSRPTAAGTVRPSHKSLWRRHPLAFGILGTVALFMVFFAGSCPMPDGLASSAGSFGDAAWTAFLSCPIHQAVAQG